MRRSRFASFLVGCLVLGSLLASDSAQAQRRRALRIAVIADGEGPQYEALAGALRAEIESLFGESGRVEFPDELRVGDWTPAGASALLAATLADRDVDLIIGLGLQISVAVADTETLPKPVILPLTERGVTGLPHEGHQSGRRNLAYLGGMVNLERDVRRFNDIVRFEKVTVVVDAGLLDSGRDVDAFVAAAAAATGVEIQIAAAEPSAAGILASIPADAEVVLLSTLPRLDPSEIPAVVQGLIERRLPSFTFGGMHLVEQGVLATVTTDDEFRRRARKISIFIERLLSGERPERFSTEFVGEERMVINLQTARAIGSYPRYRVLMEAELLHQQEAIQGEEFDLMGVMQMAALGNLDLQAAGATVEASAYDIEDTRSRWLPRVFGNGGWTTIDSDIASPIGQPEHLIDVGVRAQQLIYGPEVAGDLATVQHQQRSYEEGYEVTVQDTVLEGALSYLDLLRARTNESLQRQNLEVTRTNLALAEVRVSVGTASRDEIYRWQIELANSRADVINSIALATSSRVRVNRVLNLPLETEFTTAESSPEEAEAVISDHRMSTYLDNPWSFRILRDFFSQEAIARAPEMSEVGAALDAADANFRGQRNRWYAPRITADGGINGILYAGGVGADGMSPIAGVPGRDEFTWDVGVRVTYPIFNGLQRRAAVGQARADIRALEYERDSISQRVEERMRVSLVALGSTRPAISLKRDAATAATSNLEMVTDNYRRGTVDIIRLVDAQNQALVARLDAANAVYDFLQDYVRAMRAVGEIDHLWTESGRDEIFQRLTDFAAQRGELDQVRPGSVPAANDPGVPAAEHQLGVSGDSAP